MIAPAEKQAYEPLPRPPAGLRSPMTTQQAFYLGARCGRLGQGVPDYQLVTALTAHKDARFRAACAGHKLGRQQAGLPPLAAWQRTIEERLARAAS